MCKGIEDMKRHAMERGAQQGDYGVERGAQKLKVSVDEFARWMEEAGYQIPQSQKN